MFSIFANLPNNLIMDIVKIETDRANEEARKKNYNALVKNLDNMFNKNPNNKDGDFQLSWHGKVFVGLSEATYFYFDYIMHENYLMRQKKDKEFFERIRQR